MKILAKDNRVLFVDPTIALSNLLIEPSLFKGHALKTIRWLKGVQQINPNLYVYYPPPLMLQYGHFNIMDKLNHYCTAMAIKKIATHLNFNRPILWIYHPYAITPSGFFGEKLVVYDCNDDVGFFFTEHFNKRNKLNAMECTITKKAQVVFATSTFLYELRKKDNPNTHLLPSGIDLEIFKEGLSSDYKIGDELHKLNRPIIGFVGGMANSKMNWLWITQLSLSYPVWTFVFVGPLSDTPPLDILQQKNIIFLGPKPYKNLPAYIKGFDVCLIPYKGEDFMRGSQPGKAFEYLALGKPVVASWIPEYEGYGKAIRISQNYEEFEQNIKYALIDSKDEACKQEFIQRAYSWTWQDRVDMASNIIKETLQCRIVFMK
ncbi:MAG: glycosyltransferase [Candidatus Magnetoovum sp. WYHC-5]|nr:glycosyltransferase [Candidatus Magnetoovum sp. WYHC-5]